ncbi:hypothetical protein [Natrialba asiatica]|uniref:hypothetical protein n=1 Tax=Natrialba asiatica TaxID=64602 RepID=UPI0009FBC6B1|nr:hypothetical protein [Natrialba asiatica]
MRPNIDIPWSIHGKIKEYSQQQEITIEEAYIEALELGTDQLPLDGDVTSFDGREWLPFGPRLVRSAGEESHHINRVTTCLPHIYHRDQPVVTRTRNQDMASNEFVSCLSTLQSTGHLADDWFTVHQLGGAKIGRGLSNFARVIENSEGLFRNSSFPLYKQGSGIYIAELVRDSEYLIIRFELPQNSEVLTNISLSFIIDGYPMSGQEYYKIARAFGFKELFNARDHKCPRIGIRFDEPVEISPVEEIYKDTSDDEPWVSGLMIENPFQSNPDLLDHLEWNSENNPTDLKEAKTSIETLQNYNTLYCELNTHHPTSDDPEYRLESISGIYLSSIFNRNNVWNISPKVSW